MTRPRISGVTNWTADTDSVTTTNGGNAELVAKMVEAARFVKWTEQNNIPTRTVSYDTPCGYTIHTEICEVKCVALPISNNRCVLRKFGETLPTSYSRPCAARSGFCVFP